MSDSKNSGTIVTKLLDLARADAKFLEELERFRRAVVVMFTDIQGSTAYFEKYGDAAGLLMVHRCNATIRSIAEKHGGRVIKSIGDGMMASFTQPRPSVAAAIEMQCSLGDLNSVRPEAERLAVRIGLHYGTGIVRTNDIFGDVVNVASRVESTAAPGQIVISDALYEQVRGAEFRIRELGCFSLKGKTGERNLYQVLYQEEPPPSGVPEIAASAKPSAAAFKLQLVHRDGNLGEIYQVESQLRIGRLEGDVRFANDATMAPLNARVFVQDKQLFVEDLTNGSGSVFVRLAGGYTLQHDDVIIMGQQLFRFEEMPGAMSAVTRLGATLADINDAAGSSVAQLVRLDRAGMRVGTYPLRNVEMKFGRTRGNYMFSDDKLMSRLHARILQRGEDFLLEDAGSRNGTFIKVRDKAALPPGSAALVGSQLFRVMD